MRKHELNLDLVRNARLGRINKVKEALQAGADIDAIGEDGYTALMEAVLYCHEDVVEYLLANGADINLQQHLGSTVLMGAQTKSMVELLARNGADPFLLSNEQQSPFDLMLTNKVDEAACAYLNSGLPIPPIHPMTEKTIVQECDLKRWAMMHGRQAPEEMLNQFAGIKAYFETRLREEFEYFCEEISMT